MAQQRTELVCSGRIGAGDVTEEPKKKHEPPRARTRNADSDRVPFEPEEDFDDLTYRALLTARGVPEKYAHLLRLLKDCEEAHQGALVREQQRGASYKRLAAIGHRVGMARRDRDGTGWPRAYRFPIGTPAISSRS